MANAERARTGYHNLARPELLELVPKTAEMIFDLGCGTGALGQAIKQRQKCYVAGIELNQEAAEIAKKNIDTIYNDNLNRFDPSFSKNRYDCIIFGDILEHLIAPWAVLKKFAGVLTDDGQIIASIPNIAHPFIIRQLQKGLFRYEQAGLLDVTHLRFFTKTTIFQLFTKCGLKITKFKAYPSEDNPVQYHVTAQKATGQYKEPLVTILVLTFNGVKYTSQCLYSIKQKTNIPYKMIVIDNASKDGTVELLRKDTEIYHIENDHNLGFARGFNVGLECVDTPYFVIANNDIVVTDNWLHNMMTHINSDEKLLALGPRSNFVSGPQLIEGVTYKTQAGLEEYAKAKNWNIKNSITYFQRIVFFCVLLKSVALQKVGLLDEMYGLGNFEDDDYCVRIHRAGYKTAFDNTVFIHHYGSKSFLDNKIDYAKLMEENKKKFMEKWKIKEV